LEPFLHPDLVVLASVSEPIMLAVGPDHGLAGAASVALADLADQALALPDFDFGVRRIVDRACAAAGFRLNPVLSSNVFQTLRDFVLCGDGAAILPMRAIEAAGRSGALRAIPIAGSAFNDATIDVIMLRQRRLPRILRAFVDADCRDQQHSRGVKGNADGKIFTF
jgi:DNA-binding transcriptional LysR family regulator